MKKFASVLKRKNIFLLLLVFPIMFLSCRGDEGPRGPRGADGADGADAVKVIQYEKVPSDWSGDVNGYKTILNVPEITEDIYQNGAVMVYLLNEGTSDKYANILPYTYLYNGTTEYMDYNAYVGKIEITLRWTDSMVNTTLAPNNNYIFKVVVMEGVRLEDLKKNSIMSNVENIEKYYNVTPVKRY